jgi:hypothetical protein
MKRSRTTAWAAWPPDQSRGFPRACPRDSPGMADGNGRVLTGGGERVTLLAAASRLRA